jgi:uncharacterized protein YdaU (DUF1376 family)
MGGLPRAKRAFMAELPYLPLWTDAYLADTYHLTDTQHGLYLRLLMLMWRTPGCRVPNNDEWLAKRFRDMDALRAIIGEFCQSDGNWITQNRLTFEYEQARKRSTKQSERAKSRWNKEKPSSRGNAERHQSGNASISISRTIPIEESKKDIDRRADARQPKGTRLALDWAPSIDDLAFADKAIGTERTTEEVEKFKDYWIARNDTGAIKRDWHRTWRNWIRNSNRGNGNGHGRPRTFQDDRLSVSRAAGRLAEAAERGEFTFGPRPGLLPAKSEADVLMLPKRRGP